MKTEHRVYITASASSSCAGVDNAELFESICQGKSGIKQYSDYFFEATPALGKLCSSNDFYEELIEQCQKVLTLSKLDNFNETLLLVGSSVGGMATTERTFFKEGNYKNINPSEHNINTLASLLNDTFNFYDHLSFSTACTSSANALGYAYEVLSKGLYKNVLVVGADALSQTTVGGFLTLGVLSSEVCRPFDRDRQGMNVAEGIACLLLEREATKDSVELCGVGYSSDAHHITHPHPKAQGALLAMNNALKSAKLSAKDIDYINAHGTGTQVNDEVEAYAIKSFFPHRPSVSSTKSITGHTLGCAGALEAIVSVLATQQQTIPKNSFLTHPQEPDLNLPQTTTTQPINYVMSNSFAFGGNNCSLIFGRVK